MRGLVFDIKQMAVHDGPGVRTTVFLKGCPLSCNWCHNPEGISADPQLMVSISSCIRCGRCVDVCPVDCDPGACNLCGKCIEVCPLHLRRIAGVFYEAEQLAGILLKDREILESMDGGVTFSGGEPLLQSDFVLEVIKNLKGMHTAVETSGFCNSDIFNRVLDAADFIMMDIKLADSGQHKRYCGRDNGVILGNLKILKNSGKPFIIRIPLIPGVNDTEGNLAATAGLLEGAGNLQRVEFLSYHRTAGAKYEMVFRQYCPAFDTERQVAADYSPFYERKIPYVIY